MKKPIFYLTFFTVLFLLNGCRNLNNENQLDTYSEVQINWNYEVNKAPDLSKYNNQPEYGYWWESEMENNSNWWKENYQTDDSYWHEESYYLPLNEYVPNSEFKFGDTFMDNEYQYYRFHRFEFSVMPYQVKDTSEIIHCANFNYSYTWYYEPKTSAVLGPTIVLPDTIQEKLNNGYYIKDPTAQFMNTKDNTALKDNNHVLTQYMTGSIADFPDNSYGRLIQIVRNDTDKHFIFQHYKQDTLSYMVQENIRLAGGNTFDKIYASSKHVYLYSASFGFCKTTPFTSEDIESIVQAEFMVIFPDKRDLDSCPLDSITDENICSTYLKANIGSPLKVIPILINPFSLTTSSDNENYPLYTLVEEPFIQYMRE